MVSRLIKYLFAMGRDSCGKTLAKPAPDGSLHVSSAWSAPAAFKIGAPEDPKNYERMLWGV